MYNPKAGALYTRKGNSKDFICTETHKKCERVTQHFIEFNRFLKKHRHASFYTHARNLCAETNCPIWQNVMKKLTKQR
mgnify:CR=1 FL=1